MAGIDERFRRLVALVLVICGCALIVWGAAEIIAQPPDQATIYSPSMEFSTGDANPGAAKERTGRLLQQILFLTLVLTVLFIVSSYAFLLWSRRYRKRLLQKPGEPTHYDDVWSQYRLPEDWDEGSGDRPSTQHPDEA